MGGDYRKRRLSFARSAAGRRLGSSWTVGGRIAVGVIGAVLSYGFVAIVEQRAVSSTALIAGVIGAIGANLIWVAGVFAWSYLAAPAEIAKDYEDRIAKLKSATVPTDAIKVINSHLELGRSIRTRLRRIPRDAPDEGWTPALKESVDWVYRAGELVEEHCLGKMHDYVSLRRSIPPAIRNAGRNPDGSPWVNDRTARWRKWMESGTNLLLACIERIDSRPLA
jgi:hypothetical protein